MMEKEKNMIQMVNYNLKENILMKKERNGKGKEYNSDSFIYNY